MSNINGKGSRNRTHNMKAFADNWDNIFKKKAPEAPKPEAPKESVKPIEQLSIKANSIAVEIPIASESAPKCLTCGHGSYVSVPDNKTMMMCDFCGNFVRLKA